MIQKSREEIIRDFRMRQNRQLLAIAVTLVLILFPVLLYKHPDIFGEISRNVIFTLQVVLIAAFICFSVINWRCPVCRKYLGSDINKLICRRCGTRLR